MFLEISQYSQENICVEAASPATLLKRGSNTGVFWNIFEIFKIAFFYRTTLVAISESNWYQRCI